MSKHARPRYGRLQFFGTLAGLVVLMTPACAVAAPSSDDVAAAKTVISAVNLDWVAAVQAHDAHRVAAPYAEDAVSVGRSGRVLAGRAAIEQAEAAQFASGPALLDGSLDDDGIQLQGELIYEWGHSALHWRDPDGTVRPSAGHFLTVWRLDPDHQWRIIRNLTL
jgi:uncharacterized protein (TIGR02246 family)